MSLLLLGAGACGFDPPDSDGSSSSSTGDSSPGGSGVVPPDTTGTTTPEPSTTSGLDSGSSGSTGTNFIEPTGGDCLDPGPDGSVWRCTYECDLLEQDCPEGEKCSAWANDGSNAWNATRCIPLPPDPVAPGGSCTVEQSPVSGVDDCELGSVCWGVDPDALTGTCAAFCDPLDPAACAEPQACLGLNDGAMPVCLSPCDPLAADACGPGEVCRVLEAFGAYCVPEVGGTIEGNTGDCGSTTCAPGSMCVGANLIPGCADECCTPFCDTSDPGADAGCAARDRALSCMPVYRPGNAPEGLESLGMCTG